MGPREHIAFLAGSENRVRILEALREQPRRQCDLVRECGLSRSTVHRALDGLDAREWIRNEAGQYRLTTGGTFVLEQYTALETAMRRVEEWGSFLNRLGDVAGTLPPEVLDDATLVTTSPENPHAALTRFTDAFTAGGVETFYGISPVVSPMLNEAANALVEAETEMELIVDDSVLDASRASYPDALDDAYAFENVALFRYPRDLDFGLAILDDRVLVSASNDRGALNACLDGTNEGLLAWAREVYDDYRTAAQRVDVAPQPQ